MEIFGLNLFKSKKSERLMKLEILMYSNMPDLSKKEELKIKEIYEEMYREYSSIETKKYRFFEYLDSLNSKRERQDKFKKWLTKEYTKEKVLYWKKMK